MWRWMRVNKRLTALIVACALCCPGSPTLAAEYCLDGVCLGHGVAELKAHQMEVESRPGLG